MNLTQKQREIIVQVALSHLDRPFSARFDCITFARCVYGAAGVEIPLLKSTLPPPDLNITKEELEIGPVSGSLIFLRDRYDPRKHRAWTHVVIALSDGMCIHCSLFYGRKVVISNLEQIMKDRYDFVDCAPPAS
ncbi:MAG: NlpC/P60 family protein [bacterium]